MSNNRTFKIGLEVMEHKCLATAVSKEEMTWHSGYILNMAASGTIIHIFGSNFHFFSVIKGFIQNSSFKHHGGHLAIF